MRKKIIPAHTHGIVDVLIFVLSCFFVARAADIFRYYIVKRYFENF